MVSPSTIYGYRKEVGKFIDYIIPKNIPEINLYYLFSTTQV
jgi:hypothetical protein